MMPCGSCGVLLAAEEIAGGAECPVCGGLWNRLETGTDLRILWTLRRIATALESVAPEEEPDEPADPEPWKGNPRRRRPS
jgi:hypothetical protein